MKKTEQRYALDVLVLAFQPHVGVADARIQRILENVPNVRHITSNYSHPDSVRTTIRKKSINTIVLAVHEYFDPWEHGSRIEKFRETGKFIESIRIEYPKIVFILDFPSVNYRNEFLSSCQGRFNHYLYWLSTSSPEDVQTVLNQCDMWHQKQFEYDVALSFAGEDRSIVEEVARHLKANATKVFYDRYEQSDLLGKDLYQHFQGIYRDQARYCIIFASHHYAEKLWTNHELRQAQARVFAEQQDYLIPIRIDDTDIPGLNQTVAYLNARDLGAEQIGDIILEKLFYKSYRRKQSST